MDIPAARQFGRHEQDLPLSRDSLPDTRTATSSKKRTDSTLNDSVDTADNTVVTNLLGLEILTILVRYWVTVARNTEDTVHDTRSSSKKRTDSTLNDSKDTADKTEDTLHYTLKILQSY